MDAPMNPAAPAPPAAAPAAPAVQAPAPANDPALLAQAQKAASQSNLPLYVASAAAVLAAAWLARQTAGAVVLAPSTAGLQNVGAVLAPLFAAAAFIERASEVVISSTRDRGALLIQQNIEKSTGDTQAAWQRGLDIYRFHTQRYAFVTSLFLAFFAAVVGVRAVGPLLDLSPFATPVAAGVAAASPGQAAWFPVFDIAITALLLAGGADGIHQVVTTITDFLDKTRKGGSGQGAGAA